jgi:2-polyprenyl-6-methoxyphenol hydroxylase-like FAD-dependent oxidoreductase
VTRIAVVGAGLAGLAASLFLARRGCDVLLIEQDAAGPDPLNTLFPAGSRRGAPQARQSHMFLGRAVDVLRHQAADVMAELDRTAITIDFRTRFPGGDLDPQLGDQRLVALGCRRVAFEWVLRRAVMREQGVRLITGKPVDGLDAIQTARGEWDVLGVSAGKETLEADLVVDATGVTAIGKRLLTEMGLHPAFDWRRPAGFMYLTQWFRMESGWSFPDQRCLPYAEGRFASVATFPGDHGYFSLTYMTPSEEPLLRSLRESAVLSRVLETYDLARPWVKSRGARRIGPVVATSGGFDQRSSMQAPDNIRVSGIAAIGEAAMRTNPTRGRGAALALMHAQLLADVVGSCSTDRKDLVSTFAKRTEQELVPWFESTVALDNDRHKRLVSGLSDDGSTDRSVPLELSFSLHALHDPTLYRAIALTLNMFMLPEQILSEPDVAGRLGYVAKTTVSDLDELLQGTTRREFERIVKL